MNKIESYKDLTLENLADVMGENYIIVLDIIPNIIGEMIFSFAEKALEPVGRQNQKDFIKKYNKLYMTSLDMKDQYMRYMKKVAGKNAYKLISDKTKECVSLYERNFNLMYFNALNAVNRVVNNDKNSDTLAYSLIGLQLYDLWYYMSDYRDKEVEEKTGVKIPRNTKNDPTIINYMGKIFRSVLKDFLEHYNNDYNIDSDVNFKICINTLKSNLIRCAIENKNSNN